MCETLSLSPLPVPFREDTQGAERSDRVHAHKKYNVDYVWWRRGILSTHHSNVSILLFLFYDNLILILYLMMISMYLSLTIEFFFFSG